MRKNSILCNTYVMNITYYTILERIAVHKMHFVQRPSKPRSHHCIILLLHTQSVRIAHISLGFASGNMA